MRAASLATPAAARHQQVRDRDPTRLRSGRPAAKSSTDHAASTPNCAAVGASCGARAPRPRTIASRVGEHLARHVERVDQARQELQRGQLLAGAPSRRRRTAWCGRCGSRRRRRSGCRRGRARRSPAGAGATPPRAAAAWPRSRLLGDVDAVDDHVGRAHEPVDVLGRDPVALDERARPAG